MEQGVNAVQVPEPEFLDRDPDNLQENDYWEKADLRVVLKYSEFKVLGNTYKIAVPEVQDAEGKVMVAATNLIDPRNANACANNPVGSSDTFHNNREGKDIRMLEIDMEALLACIDQHASTFKIEDGLRNDSEGGLVFHFSVDDSAMKGKSTENKTNNYGVRVKNGAELDQKIEGLTVATNQAMYVQGDYNSNDKKKKPASFLADSLNILSNDWKDLTDKNGNECFQTKQQV